MNDPFDAARMHRAELDREIDIIRTERLIRAASPARQGLATRARSGLGRGLISLGTALLGSNESGARSAS